MSQQDDEGVLPEQAAAPAGHGQLDDHRAPDEAPYNGRGGLRPLLGWLGEEAPPGDGRPYGGCVWA